MLGGGKITDKDIRLERLRRDSVTGLLDTTNINTRENLISEEEKEIEIQKVVDFIKKRYKNTNFNGLGFSTKNPRDIEILGPRGGETKILLDSGKDFRSDLLNKTFFKKKT